MKEFSFIILIAFNLLFVQAQENYPSPSNKTDVLFYIQHNQGKNTFIYALNKNNKGEIDYNNPIQVYRQLFDKNGEVRPLTGIQKTFAYGINIKKLSGDKYEANIVSIPDQKLYLHLPKSGTPFVITKVNGQYIRLDRIFIKIKDGTSGLSTKLDYILYYGQSNGKNQTLKQEMP